MYTSFYTMPPAWWHSRTEGRVRPDFSAWHARGTELELYCLPAAESACKWLEVRKLAAKQVRFNSHPGSPVADKL